MTKTCECGCGAPVKPGNRFLHRHNLPNLNGALTSTAWQPGEAPALKHGLRSRRPLPLAQISAEVAEITAALADAAPVRDVDGNLPAADEAAMDRAARALHRSRKASEWADNTGRYDEKGNVNPIARHELDCELGTALAALGMTPESRFKLLGDVAPARRAAATFAEQIADAIDVEGQDA